MSLNDNEVHDDLMGDSDITPDSFKELFGEIAYLSGSDLSLKAADAVFAGIGASTPEEVRLAIQEMHDIALNPGEADMQLRRLSSLAQSIQSLYVLASTRYSEEYARHYPQKIERGDKDREMAKLEAKTAGIRAVKNFLRNTFYNVSRAASAAQSLLKSETQDKSLNF